MAMVISVNFSAQATASSCPGYTYPSALTLTNHHASCGVSVRFYLVDRATCGTNTPWIPFSSVLTVSPSSTNSIPTPSWWSSYSGEDYAIMADIWWDGDCDHVVISVQVDGMAGVGNNCWSCGPYVAPPLSTPMPPCTSCDPSGTAFVWWHDVTGNLEVYP